MKIAVPDKLSLARLNTPLQPLKRFSKALGGPLIWLKRDDLTATLATGNKIRKLEFSLALAIEQGCDTIITCGGTQSNHCRATAALAAQLGLKCHLILRQDTDSAEPVGNLLLDKLFGAKVDIFPKSGFGSELGSRFAQICEHYQAAGNKPYAIPTGASDGVGLWGYIETARELKMDFSQHKISPNNIFCATGSGGTQGGLSLGCELYDLNCKVVGFAVCDDQAYFHAKVFDDWKDWRQRYAPDYPLNAGLIHTNDRYIGKGYGIADDSVFELIHDLAKIEGVVLDPTYTGKAFFGLVDLIKSGHYADESDVVFVHTGGIYGLLAQQDQLQAVLTE